MLKKAIPLQQKSMLHVIIKEKEVFGMTKPKGLGIDNGTLFVCDDGLKITGYLHKASCYFLLVISS